MNRLWLHKLFLTALLLAGWSVAAAQAEADVATVQPEVATLPANVEAADDANTDVASDEAVDSAIATPAPTAIVPGSELESMTGPLIRMVLSLAAVLALVGIFAWLAKRFRGGQLQGGLIQIVSGLSLGPKEKVVLLCVGDEEILVGMSPAGMQQLHVLNKPSARFSLDMANRAKGEDGA